MREITIVVKIDRRALVVLLVAAFLSIPAASLVAESLTLTTHYPSPTGAYVKLLTTGMDGAAAADSVFGRDGANVIVVPATNPGGRLGVGTAAPLAKLDLRGSLRVVDGTQGAGKVLTSDASGQASWQHCTYAP